MDWQIRIALIVLGLGLIGYIVYDYKRRQKSNQEKEFLIKKMRDSAEQVDSAGFDYTGVGNVRKVVKEPTFSEIDSEPNLASRPDHEDISSEEVNQTESTIEIMGEIETHDKVSITEKAMPSEQLSFDELSEPDMVCSLILRAKEGEAFKGGEFLPLLLSQGLRHGDMGIFHRHATHNGKAGPVIYSVANAVKPGTFDLKNIERFETPAFAFFMTLPGPKEPVSAYEGMVKTIRMIQSELGGQILDESKSVYTEQTHQHQLELIRSYLTKKITS
ncbi:cell division protein ZipA [Aliikangiella sp. G2MR2-5]|uniref:cell division protein ZipA n=1 Tax=Aliikangiella sp. G2MR2-5 TaxID=2788943 RepID=UPI0018A93D9E|nr:cell division protein ZipA [Aliikangiella sp. G2MR2-5]